MKTTASNQTAVPAGDHKSNLLNQFSENTSEFAVFTCSDAEIMNPSSNSIDQLPSEIGSSVNWQCGLISEFDKLDLSDKFQHVLLLDTSSDKVMPDGNTKQQYSLPSDCPVDTKKHMGGSVNHNEFVEKAKIKSECKVPVEISTSADVVSMSGSTKSPADFCKNLNCVKYEDNLAACFSEIDLSEKSSCGIISCDADVSGSLKRENLLCENDLSCETAKSSSRVKQEITENFVVTESVVKNSPVNQFQSDKAESVPESELLHFGDDQSNEQFLIERGAKKSVKDQREPKKLSRTMKAPKEEWSKYLKHMSGGSVLSVSTDKSLDKTSGCFNLISLDCSSAYESNLLQGSGFQASLPLYFDQNEICPIREDIQGGHSHEMYSNATTTCDGNLFSDMSFCPTVRCNDNNLVSQQYLNTSDSLLDMHYPSPVSETSDCNGYNSRSTSPESGYGSSPRLSYFSDDGAELCKRTEQSAPESIVPCVGSVQSHNELFDTPDLSLVHENYSFDVTEHTEEDKQRINVILQDLKKCEEYVKPNNADMAGNVDATLSLCPYQPDCQTPQQGSSVDMGYPCLEERSLITDGVQQHQPSAHVNVPLQQDSAAQVSSPQVIVIYVPYAAKPVDKGTKSLKPILPKLEGQQKHSQSAKERLLSTLDCKKLVHYQYRIYEKLCNKDKTVIYIENNKTRQTNLHIAVIKQDVELAYCILEIHRQYKKNMTAVNSRDIYKKTALQYAISNVMTLFVEYLKEFGAK